MTCNYFGVILVLVSFYGLSAYASAKDGAPPGKKANPETALSDRMIKYSQEAASIAITWPEQWQLPVSFNQQCKLIGEQQDAQRLECSEPDQGEITISWGDMWRVVTILPNDLEEKTFHVELLHLSLAWPVKQNYRLSRQVAAGQDACSAGVAYQAKAVWYCPGDRFEQKQCKKEPLDSDGDKIQRASLRSVGWDEKGPLPESAFIELVKVLHNPLYKQRFKLKLPYESSSPSAIYQAAEELNIALSEDPELKYGVNAELLVFETREACVSGGDSGGLKRSGYIKSAYASGELSGTRVKACTWAKVVKHGKDISKCVQARVSEGKVTYRLESNQIEGKRLVIVVARDDSLDHAGVGSGIQKALLEWLKGLKKKQIRIPLNLLTIESDGRVLQILRGEDLASVAISSNEKHPPPNIEGIIGLSVTFDQEGFRTLKDLEFVERKLHVLGIAKIAKVLYITGGSLQEKEKIFNAELGTPLGWKKDGVDLHVVTNGDCGPWINRADAQCTTLVKKQQVDEMRKILDSFLSL